MHTYFKRRDLNRDMEFCLRHYQLKRQVDMKQCTDSRMYNPWQCSNL